MKRVVSVSIGSSIRDKKVNTRIMGEEFSIERIGTDGDIDKAVELLRQLDGKVDAFGMGGIDLYLFSGPEKKYVIRDAVRILQAAGNTPIVDGTGVKNTLEKRVVESLDCEGIVPLSGKKVLMTSGVDRYMMAEAFVRHGCSIVLGDFIFSMGIPFAMTDLRQFQRIAGLLMPVFSRLPFKWLYPTGNKQKINRPGRFDRYYKEADIVAGDFHFIRKYLPEDMKGKIVVTNTVTAEDVTNLKERGTSLLVTTTPDWDGRSFGTNVIEAVMISLSGKRPLDMKEEDYYRLIGEMGLKPRIEVLNT